MEKYIHLQNLALLKKRLAEPHSDTTHQVLLKVLAEEEPESVIALCTVGYTDGRKARREAAMSSAR